MYTAKMYFLRTIFLEREEPSGNDPDLSAYETLATTVMQLYNWLWRLVLHPTFSKTIPGVRENSPVNSKLMAPTRRIELPCIRLTSGSRHQLGPPG